MLVTLPPQYSHRSTSIPLARCHHATITLARVFRVPQVALPECLDDFLVNHVLQVSASAAAVRRYNCHVGLC